MPEFCLAIGFGAQIRSRRGLGCRRHRNLSVAFRNSRRLERLYRGKENPTVSQRQAKFAKIVFGQMRQRPHVNIVVSKNLAVFPETLLHEPVFSVSCHRAGP